MRRLLLATFASLLASTAARAAEPLKFEVDSATKAFRFEHVYIIETVPHPLIEIIPVRQDVTTQQTVSVPNTPLAPKIEQAVGMSTF